MRTRRSVTTGRPRGLTPDGTQLVVTTDSGEDVAIAVEALRATLRQDRPEPARLEMQMDSGLTPREIQERIRAGASPEEVAESAGVPVERIQAFAAPVLAERIHVVTLALSSSVRRRGEPVSGRTLRDLVTERLVAHQIPSKAVDWQAWRTEDRQWRVSGTVTTGEEVRRGEFLFDLKARFSTAVDDDARWLLGELSTARPRTTADPDSEPTEDLGDDELALVRALSGSPLQGGGLLAGGGLEEEPGRREDSGPIWRPGSPRQLSGAEQHDSGRIPRWPQGPDADLAGPPVAPAPVPAPAGGDVVPDDDSDLDVLYAMLGGVQEDSVTIYTGLDDRPTEPAEPVTADTEPDTRADPVDEAAAAPSAEEPRRRRRRARRSGTPEQVEVPAPAEPPVESGVDDLEQPSLLEDADQPGEAAAEAVEPPPAKKGGRRKRASIPSWDEIMFGAPRR
ncbi:septation protein SepH [Desertihabitans aurantiacus]|uniref:septation protein SepH n=1 Tax=Desertihabitans aurantiacus TaxID=2282477 RepID=UPI001300700D|nr:septation protein SepH [Desertihabitans aurantiacus]